MSNSSEPSGETTAFAPSAASPEPAPGVLGRFQLQEEVGRGAFGIVYRARDPVLDRLVALKVPRFDPNQPGARERFLREAKAAARLRHPNIVTVHDCGSEGDQHFIAFEFVQGRTLAEQVVVERPGHRQIVQWVRSLALALYHAHESSVLHRDVKPANILVDADRRCRLTDFGLSKDVFGLPPPAGSAALSDDASEAVAAAGTPAYMAPEQARGDAAAIGPHTDQYGLGVLLYELLTGRRPFAGTVPEVMAKIADPLVEPVPPRDHEPSVPIALEAIVLRATAKDPARRYASCAEMAVDLQRWLNGDLVSAPLRVPIGWVLRCPECGLDTPPPAPSVCKYCGHGLCSVEPIDPTASPGLPSIERTSIRLWTGERVRQGVTWMAWFLLMGVAVAVLLVNWRVAVVQAGGWEFPHPGFLGTVPGLKDMGSLWRGVALGLIGAMFGALFVLALVGPERAESFVELARWSLAALALGLAGWVETTTRYEQHVTYHLELRVASAGGRNVKKTQIRVMKKHDKERPLSERKYIDDARFRKFDPGHDADLKASNFAGTVSYSRSPLGFVFNPDPGRIIIAVGYDDETAGSCQCDDGVNLAFRHDHHTLEFPLRLVVDANREGVAANWRVVEHDRSRPKPNTVSLTIEVP